MFNGPRFVLGRTSPDPLVERYPSRSRSEGTILGLLIHTAETANGPLDLLGTPSGVRLSHVRRRLDRGNELEDDVGDTNEADNGPGNYRKCRFTQEDGANKDVD
jgi:hypothetical protein